MSWLTQQKREALEAWLRHTSIPMLVTLDDGEILWCNNAFELLLDYTEYELVGKKSWKDLTFNSDDLEADEVMVSKIAGGERQSYELQKEYRKKDGSLVKVIIHVLGYPTHSDKEFYLVTVIPFDKINQFALIQLNEMHQVLMMVLEILSKPSPTWWDNFKMVFSDISRWASKHPYIFGSALFVTCYIVFGEKFIVMMDQLKEVWQSLK